MFTLAPRAPLLYEITCQPPEGLEWQQVEWQRTQSEEFAQTGWRLRDSCCNVDSLPVLGAFVTRVLDCQRELLGELWHNSYFSSHLWAGYTLSELEAGTEPYFELCRDWPGFTTSVHVDHRRAVTTGQLFFNRTNDPKQNTVFYSSEQPRPWQKSQRMSTGYGQGWFTANWHKSWHKGSNFSSDCRISMKFGLHLKKP
jgi:hypothetical protein